jgi:hypothetical protein
VGVLLLNFDSRLAGSWFVKQSWLEASLSERGIMENTRMLSKAPDQSFVSQIDVTVGVAILIDSAASTNGIAVQVLHLLLTGRVGDKISWGPVRSRLCNIKKGLVKY